MAFTAHCKPGEIRNKKAGGRGTPSLPPRFSGWGFKIELGPQIFFGETYAIL